MITTLAKLKERLGITDALKDALLTQIIVGVGARFDDETQRTLARTAGATEEFRAERVVVFPRCYPIEIVTKLEAKCTEAEGWVEITNVDWLIHQSAVVRLDMPVGPAGTIARITYTGGYVMPGAVPGEGQTALPTILESAAVEQAAMWYQLQANIGVYRVEVAGGTYLELADRYWVPWVRTVLRRYRRWAVL